MRNTDLWNFQRIFSKKIFLTALRLFCGILGLIVNKFHVNTTISKASERFLPSGPLIIELFYAFILFNCINII
jgi:hypothetical protein